LERVKYFKKYPATQLGKKSQKGGGKKFLRIILSVGERNRAEKTNVAGENKVIYEA